MDKLISIAIPAYNHERYIRDCLNSVLRQDYSNLELVVIDDGSRDATPHLIEEFIAAHRQRFSQVVFRSRPNRGVSYTSNECFACATGEWVHLLGSDDILKPDKVSRMQQAIADWGIDDLGLVFADADFIDAQGQVVPRTVKETFPPGPDRFACRRLFLANRIPNPTVAIRREAFVAVGGFDESLFLEDWDMWLRLAARFPIARVPEVLASYRYHPGNTHQRATEMLEACLLTYCKFLQQHRDLLDDKTISANWRKNLHRLSRWARRHRPALLARVALDVVRSLASVPGARDYARYAEILGAHLREKPIS